jgi:hypothetical protein
MRRGSTGRQMTFVAVRSCILDGEEPERALAVVKLTDDVRITSQDIVVGW